MNKTIFIILILACLLAYAGYLGGGFVFDDRILVKENPLVKSAYLLPTVFRTGIYDYWTGAQPYDRMYRPVQMFSYYLDYCLWGLNPAGFRFGNILLHLLNSFLVFYLLFLIFKQKVFCRLRRAPFSGPSGTYINGSIYFRPCGPVERIFYPFFLRIVYQIPGIGQV